MVSVSDIPQPVWDRPAAMRKLFPNAPKRLTCRVCGLVRESTLHTTGSIGMCPCFSRGLPKRKQVKAKVVGVKTGVVLPPVERVSPEQQIITIDFDTPTLVLADFATYLEDSA